jgi:hypothetical protein
VTFTRIRANADNIGRLKLLRHSARLVKSGYGEDVVNIVITSYMMVLHDWLKVSLQVIDHYVKLVTKKDEQSISPSTP